jgi:acetoin utilization deacetylase AcuC-like enzyme
MQPRAATRDELLRAHTSEHVDRVAASAGKVMMFDADTFTSPDSYSIALLAAGAAIQAADHAVVEKEPAFALVRPPGHHAESDRAMGFCLFNSVAVAAAAMLARGLGRIAIVDIDVHHGNGTQEIFYRDPRVLYVSTHQFPFYPGTGAANEIGEGEGRGFTVNVPMDAGSTDADYLLAHRDIIGPVLAEFRPELVLVSAGYDAHERDPLASMRMSVSGYAAVIGSLRDVASRYSGLALVTEGGYELSALAACLDGSIAVLDGAAAPVIESREAPRGARAVAHARQALKPFWRAL